MSNLAHFCNRIGIDSHLLKVIKKDNILYNKTAEPISDWVLLMLFKILFKTPLFFIILVMINIFILTHLCWMTEGLALTLFQEP